MTTHNCNCPSPTDTLARSSSCGGTQYLVFLSIFETFLRSQCDLNDPCNRPKDIEEPDYEYDFIIVGSGSGGSVTAARLSEIPDWRVLLIEMGGHEPVGLQVPMYASVFNYAFTPYETVANHKSHLGSPGQTSNWSLCHVFGGCSAMNGKTYLRGNREDYDLWAELGNDGWSYAEVLPYFKKAENLQRVEGAPVDWQFHGTDGPSVVTPSKLDRSSVLVRAAEEVGLRMNDLNGFNSTGFGYQTRTKNNIRYSAARSYLWPVANSRKNLDVWLNTRATKVLVDPVTKVAYGVEVRDSSNGTRRVFASKEVIVSCGTVESPKLLLLSGIGAADDLLSVGIEPIVDLPGVGRNMQNHIGVVSRFAWPEHRQNMNWNIALDYLINRRGSLAVSAYEYVAKLPGSYAHSPNEPDLLLITDKNSVSRRCSKSGVESDTLTSIIISILVRPHSRGRISLISKDALVPPQIFPNDLDDEFDVERLVDSLKRTNRILDSDAFRQGNLRKLPLHPTDSPCARLEADSDAYYACVVRHYAIEAKHSVGTCAMGPRSDPMAVLDSGLRVYGVRGLRVVDGSVMPVVVAATTDATIVMIAEKVADVIKSEWGE